MLAFSRCWWPFILSISLQLIFPAILLTASAYTLHLERGEKQLWDFYITLLPGSMRDGQNVFSGVPQWLVFCAWMFPCPLGTSRYSQLPSQLTLGPWLLPLLGVEHIDFTSAFLSIILAMSYCTCPGMPFSNSISSARWKSLRDFL